MIYRRDSIAERLTRFAQTYKLDPKKQAKLEQTVRQKMQTLSEFS